MNIAETRRLMLDFSRVVGNKSFLEWRQEAIDDAVAANGGTADAEWDAQLASWQRTLEGVTYEEGVAVARLMERRVVSVPSYGKWARVIDEQARAGRSRPSYSQDERRFTCAVCLDTGMVQVWNPRFVEDYRNTFDDLEAAQLPPDWQVVANLWWRGQDKGPRTHMAKCDCNCKRSQIFTAEQEAFRQGTRRDSYGKHTGPPACGMAVYNPRVMPLKTANAYEDLRAWYAAHEPSQVYEWQPN